jgi:putative transposase
VGFEPTSAVLSEHQLPIAPATCYAHRSRPPSARALRDAKLKPRLAAVHEASYGAYGVRKMHAALRRAGVEIGPDQTGRLMRDLGLAGVRRGNAKRTTTRDGTAGRPADLVHSDVHAAGPDRMWVCDLTYRRARRSRATEPPD